MILARSRVAIYNLCPSCKNTGAPGDYCGFCGELIPGAENDPFVQKAEEAAREVRRSAGLQRAMPVLTGTPLRPFEIICPVFCVAGHSGVEDQNSLPAIAGALLEGVFDIHSNPEVSFQLDAYRFWE